jgi:hypothetical protein
MDPHTQVGDFLANLVNDLELPLMNREGNLIRYALYFEGQENKLPLNEESTLVASGVREFDVLKVLDPGSGSKRSVPTEPALEQVAPLFSTELEALTVINHNLVLNTRAQNKTTHAVRAFVRFFFIQLSAATLAGFVWAVSQSTMDPYECAQFGENCRGNGALEFAAAIIFIVGVFYSSQQGWKELRASEIN